MIAIAAMLGCGVAPAEPPVSASPERPAPTEIPAGAPADTPATPGEDAPAPVDAVRPTSTVRIQWTDPEVTLDGTPAVAFWEERADAFQVLLLLPDADRDPCKGLDQSGDGAPREGGLHMVVPLSTGSTAVTAGTQPGQALFSVHAGPEQFLILGVEGTVEITALDDAAVTGRIDAELAMLGSAPAGRLSGTFTAPRVRCP